MFVCIALSYLEPSSRDYLVTSDERARLQCDIIVGSDSGLPRLAWASTQTIIIYWYWYHQEIIQKWPWSSLYNHLAAAPTVTVACYIKALWLPLRQHCGLVMHTKAWANLCWVRLGLWSTRIPPLPSYLLSTLRSKRSNIFLTSVLNSSWMISSTGIMLPFT